MRVESGRQNIYTSWPTMGGVIGMSVEGGRSQVTNAGNHGRARDAKATGVRHRGLVGPQAPPSDF